MSAFAGEDFINEVWNNFLLLAPMVLLFVLGCTLRFIGFLRQEDEACMIKLLYWLISPALLFRGALAARSGVSRFPSIFAALFVCAVIASLTAYALGSRCKGGDARRVAVSAAAATKPNSIYMGMPIVLLILGDESIFYVSIYAAIGMPLHNILSPVFGELAAARGSSLLGTLKKSLLGTLKNPLVMASLLGLCFALAGCDTLPGAIDKTLQLLGSCATGLSLLALGASSAPGKVIASFTAAWRDVLVRLILHPALLLLWFRFFPAERTLEQVMVLMAAMPTAITMFILAGGMQLDSDYAAQIIIASTALSILTIPVWSVILSV